MATLPTTEPVQLVQGDTWTWLRSLPDYPASGGWSLSYYLQGPQPITISATASGDSFLVKALAAATAAYAVGTYSWAAFVTKSGDRFTVGSGTFEVTPNLATLTGVQDLRSHARKMLDAIESVLEGRAKDDVAEYQIHGRMLKRIPRLELVRLHAHYKALVRAEQGLGMGKTVGVTFGNP